MARPHIEFLQSQRLTWDDARPGRDAAGMFGEEYLSFDPAKRRNPANWSRFPPAGRATSKTICPSMRSSSSLRASSRSTRRPTASIIMPSCRLGFRARQCGRKRERNCWPSIPAHPIPLPARRRLKLYDETRLILRLDPFDMIWDRSGQDPGIADLQAWRRIMRLDPAGKCRSFLLAGLPQGIPSGARGSRMEWHSYCEEMFLIAGDLPCHCGVMKPGAYFWRPPGIEHGLECSVTGFLTFMRIPGSNENVNNWVRKAPVSLTPGPCPISSAGTGAFGTRAVAGPDRLLTANSAASAAFAFGP